MKTDSETQSDVMNEPKWDPSKVMNRTSIPIVILAAVLLALTASAETSSDTNRNTDPSKNSQVDITGKWAAACRKGPSGMFVEETYIFGKDLSYAREQRRYRDKDCAKDALNEIRAFAGSFAIVGTAKDIAPDARKIDFTVDHVFETATGAAALKEFRESGLCNIVDWKQGERRDVTGLLCRGETIPAGTVIYDVVERTGDKLYFGADSYFASTDERKHRPARIDKKVTFVKSSGLSE